jgi:drug/metabolite transporter (DMT)-like permease
MFNLVLSIFFSSLIFVIFKLFETYKIQTVYAIIVNYITAAGVGLIFAKGPLNISEIPNYSWFYGTILLGTLFIVVFNLMARTSQELGVSVASVATKMSFVLPVIFGVLVYSETLNIFKLVGILLAMGAVYLASIKTTHRIISSKSLVLPLLVFLGSGIIDTSLKFAQAKHLSGSDYPLFSATVFASAAFTGLIFIGVRSLKIPLKVNVKNILGGIVLGIPNYFSIYFLLRALQDELLNSASIFTINNVAIVLFSTLLGIILFKEKLSPKNWTGIVLAVISILMVSLM